MNEADKGHNMTGLEYWLEKEVSEPIEKYKQLTAWNEETKAEYSKLIAKLKQCTAHSTSNTREAGDALEKVVTFIIEHSVFLTVFSNIRSSTNEIDQIITFSESGGVLILKPELAHLVGLGDSDTIIIGECKNYTSKVGVTHIGKLYSVMSAHDISLALLFTREGITGSESSYSDGYGLIKILRIYEKYKNGQEVYILPFTLKDLESISSTYDFLEMIKWKKKALRLSILEESLKNSENHCNSELINQAIRRIK